MAHLRISCPYFKQGDDFAHFLANTDSVSEALEMWAALMKDFSDRLLKGAEALKDIPPDKISAGGETHWAHLEVDDEYEKTLLETDAFELDDSFDDSEFEDSAFADEITFTTDDEPLDSED